MTEKIYKPQPVCTTPAVQVGVAVDLVNIANLPPVEKQDLWQGIKQQTPALADMMQNDETLKLVSATFDAHFVMTRHEIDGYCNNAKD